MSIDARVNQVSLELTNQLDGAERRSRSGQRDQADAVEMSRSTKRDASTLRRTSPADRQRLANEQARYAIQFRADLAELADRLRRPGSA